jgi:hypothetical protein
MDQDREDYADPDPPPRPPPSWWMVRFVYPAVAGLVCAAGVCMMVAVTIATAKVLAVISPIKENR